MYLLAAWCASQAVAAVYPERPIRLIVPSPHGGNNDSTARTISPGLTESFGVQEFDELLRSENMKWSKVIREGNVKIN